MFLKKIIILATLSLASSAFAWEAPAKPHVVVRQATIDDFPAMWKIFQAVVEPGDTYVFDPHTTMKEAKDYYWTSKAFANFVAIVHDQIVGMYTIKPDQPGLGSHVANASYMVHPDYQGQKIGYVMALNSLEQAKKLGFNAIQFNMVVSTNSRAVSLLKKIGFSIIGTIPKVFNHKTLGYVDAHIMHRFLE